VGRGGAYADAAAWGVLRLPGLQICEQRRPRGELPTATTTAMTNAFAARMLGERPLVIGSLYDGQGQAGIPATPGGQGTEQDTSAYKQSSDAAPGAQANITAGHSPAWHGASALPALPPEISSATI
jgi:hypothetical protein